MHAQEEEQTKFITHFLIFLTCEWKNPFINVHIETFKFLLILSLAKWRTMKMRIVEFIQKYAGCCSHTYTYMMYIICLCKVIIIKKRNRERKKSQKRVSSMKMRKKRMNLKHLIWIWCRKLNKFLYIHFSVSFGV